MVLIKEYRICLPMTVEEYKIGQIYMVARHSLEESGDEGGVEVVENSECEHPVYGRGKFTEKRIHLSKRIPYWLQALCPKIFYVTEKSWNYYPYTISEYTCSFIPRFNVKIETKYEDNDGSSENALNLPPDLLQSRIVEDIDISLDIANTKNYREEEDLKFFRSRKTARGPLTGHWKRQVKPVMCCYKVVMANFDIWGLQSKVEKYIHVFLKEVFLVGHRKAFAWIDDWIDMSLEDVKCYERMLQMQANNVLQTGNGDLSENSRDEIKMKKKTTRST